MNLNIPFANQTKHGNVNIYPRNQAIERFQFSKKFGPINPISLLRITALKEKPARLTLTFSCRQEVGRIKSSLYLQQKYDLAIKAGNNASINNKRSTKH